MPETVTLNHGLTGALVLTALPFGVLEHDYPAPAPIVQYASSADTEGDLPVAQRFGNRTISALVECTTQAALAQLQALVAQIGREGGTWRYETPNGAVVTFDLVTFSAFTPALTVFWDQTGYAEVQLELPAKPFGRGAEVALTDRVETTLPALVFTETSIPGDVPALGRLVVDEDQGVDQAWLVWGQRQRNFSAAASAALFIQAEDLTVQGGSSKVAGAAGASGSGNNVVRNTDLTTSFVSVLSGQLSASSTYLSHVGSYRVFARTYCPTSNTGQVEVALEWAEGDFRRVTRNPVATLDPVWEGSFRIVDLGQVALTPVAQGTQRWEPRVVARSTGVGDEIDIDWLIFLPADDGGGEISSLPSLPSPSSFTARDEFNQTAGALGAKALPVGGTWTTSGATTDFNVSGAGTVTRSQANDVSGPRLAVQGSAAGTSAAQVDRTVDFLAINALGGVLLRYVDANNYLLTGAGGTGKGGDALNHHIAIRVGGVTSTILFESTNYPGALTTTVRVRAAVFSNGAVILQTTDVGTGAIISTSVTGHPALAVGGPLASGLVGIWDQNSSGASVNRTYDNYAAWIPSADAAVCASQSAEIRQDQVIREDAGGTIWTAVSSYEGDYLQVPPTGPAGRTTQFLVKGSRSVPGSGADGGIDDISARLYVTPRYLVIPS